MQVFNVVDRNDPGIQFISAVPNPPLDNTRHLTNLELLRRQVISEGEAGYLCQEQDDNDGEDQLKE